jgi:hypothetical protein
MATDGARARADADRSDRSLAASHPVRSLFLGKTPRDATHLVVSRAVVTKEEKLAPRDVGSMPWFGLRCAQRASAAICVRSLRPLGKPMTPTRRRSCAVLMPGQLSQDFSQPTCLAVLRDLRDLRGENFARSNSGIWPCSMHVTSAREPARDGYRLGPASRGTRPCPSRTLRSSSPAGAAGDR